MNPRFPPAEQIRYAVGAFWLLVGLSLIVPISAHAQTPPCSLDPIDLPLFEATPAAAIAATPQQPDETVTDPSDDEMIDAAGMLVACTNDDSAAVRYAVFTDRYLASLFVGRQPADQPAFEQMIATGESSPKEPSILESVSDIELMDDGRVAVTLAISTPQGEINDRLILVWDEEADTWLIDEIVALDPPPLTPGKVT